MQKAAASSDRSRTTSFLHLTERKDHCHRGLTAKEDGLCVLCASIGEIEACAVATGRHRRRSVVSRGGSVGIGPPPTATLFRQEELENHRFERVRAEGNA